MSSEPLTMHADDEAPNDPQPPCSPLRTAIETAAAEDGASLASLTVLAVQTDPFRVDTPRYHRCGRWLAETLDELGIDRIHPRGIHYRLLGRTKPDGTTYE